MIDSAPVALSTVTVTAQALHGAISDALESAGSPREAASVQAWALVEAELRGHPSHGARRLQVLVERVKRGLIDPTATPHMSWTASSVLSVDGRNGFGPVVAQAAVREIAERASVTGIAMTAIARAGHVGMLAPYVESLAGAGCIGIAFTTSEALVHPWGGKRALLGTNPIGLAIPTGAEPLVVDMSTSEVSVGKILDRLAKGQAIPIGWAIDSGGEATTDPSAATHGALSPFGGPKGYALGLALEVLVALATGTAMGTHVRGTLDTEHGVTKGDVFIAISLAALGKEDLLETVTAYLDEIRASGQSEPVLVPGDRARDRRSLAWTRGIEIDESLWGTLNTLRGGI